VLYFVGTDHPITSEQVRCLESVSGLRARNCCGAEPIEGHALRLVPRATATEQQLRETVATLAPEAVACLCLTGGDTALLVCRALGIRSLRLHAEFAPGAPLAYAEGGAFHGTPVLLKSGGFGEADLLCRVLDTFGRKDSICAP
jgi:D-threonate/D-erythronate kinase